MLRNYEYKEVAVQELLLDEENPRFASSILVKESTNKITQEMIIEHLLRYSDVIKLAQRINEVGELHGSEIITCTKKGDKFVVLEGNRRTCACKLLLDRKLIPEQYRSNFPFITEHAKANIEKVMVTIYPDRESVQAYLSDRHIAGVRRWSALEKNNYYMNLFLQYGNVESVKKHTSDSVSVVTKSIKKYQFFMDVFNILKSKYTSLEIEKIDYLPMVDRFMDTLVGDDEEVGLNLEIDYEKLQYLCIPEKRDVYDKILLKIGEAFLVRKERRLCGDGELPKVVGSEIYGKNDQKRLILEDIRIPGLYSLIQQYKSDGKTETSGAEGDKKTDSAVKNDTSEGTENGASKNAGEDSASREGDMSKDSAQTANGEKNGNTSSNEDKGKEDNKQERGAGGNSNLPYFFQGLNYHNLDPNDSDSHGVSRVCKEIQLFSNRKLVDNFPMAAAFLTRTIIEHALIYYSKKHKIQGQNKFIWEDISNNGKAIKLSLIINKYKSNLANYILDIKMREYFTDLFGDYNTNVNPLNWVVHRPDEYQLPAKDLIDLPRKGLLALINFLIA